MKFATAYSPHPRNAEKNTNIQTVWKKAVCEESGKDILIYDGYREVDKEIQEEAKGVGIHNYIEVDADNNIRAVRQVNESKAMYGDFTNVAETRAELVKSIKDAKHLNDWIKQQEAELKAYEKAEQDGKISKEHDLDKKEHDPKKKKVEETK